MDDDQPQEMSETPGTNERATENPFPGVRTFEAAETYLFFGREGQSDEILRILGQHRFVAVVGTSGSGKSSLVRAGMIPSLEAGYMAGGGTSWRFVVIRPGEQADPIASLAHRLADPVVFGESEIGSDALARIIDTTLRRSSYGLIDAARQQHLEPGENLLVLVDQFEELFRLRASRARNAAEDVEAAFVRLLLEATRQTELPIYVVITMRSDFIGDCSEFRDLPEALNRAQFLIPRMTRDQRREAIEGPIAVSGASIAPRLVQRMLNDVGDNPDQLPILQHALMRTWAAWYASGKLDQPIELDHYQSIGGWENALSLHADEAFNELDARGKEIAEKVFKALVERTADSRETRRPGQISMLAAVSDAGVETVIKVIDHFRLPGRTFLMPPAAIALNSDSVIDISHESLIRLWKRLRDWVAEEAESAVIYRRLADAAERYKQQRGSLYRDPELKQALDWKEKSHPNQAWGERYAPHFADAFEFLQLSHADQERDRAERAAARDKLLASERSLRIRNWILRGVVVALILVTFFAGLSARSSYREKRSAEAHELRIRAYQARDESPELSALLAIESARIVLDLKQYEIYTDGILRDALRIVKPEVAYPAQSLNGQESQCNSKPLTISNRGRSGNVDRFKQASDRLDFAPDGESFVAVCNGDLDTKHLVPTAGVVDRGKNGQVTSLEGSSADTTVAFAPDGSRVAAAGEDGKVRLYDANTGHEVWEKPVEGNGPVTALSIGQTGRWLVVGYGTVNRPSPGAAQSLQEMSSGGLSLLNIEDGSPRSAPELNGWVVDADFSPNGQKIAAADWNGEAILFNPDTGQELLAPRLKRTFTLEGKPRPYNATTVAFSNDPAGRYVAFGFGTRELRQNAGLVVVYDTTTKPMTQVGGDIRVSDEVSAIRFSPPRGNKPNEVRGIAVVSRQHIWVEDLDESGKTWNIRGAKPIEIQAALTANFSDAAFSPDGQYLVITDTAGFVRFYEPSLVEQVTYRRFVGLGQLLGLKFNSSGKLLAAIGTQRTEVADVNRDLLASRVVTLPGASPLAQGPAAFSREFTTAVVPAKDGWEYVYELESEQQFKPHQLVQHPVVVSSAPAGVTAASPAAIPAAVDMQQASSALTSLAVDADGKLIAFSNGHLLEVQDSGTGNPLWRHDGDCDGLAFSRDSRRLAAAELESSGGLKVHLWNASDGSHVDWDPPPINPPSTHPMQTHALSFSPDGRLLGIATDVGLFIADLTNQDLSQVSGVGPASAIAFSSDGEKIAVADDKGSVFLFNIAGKPSDFSVSSSFRASTDQIEGLDFGYDGHYLMVLSATDKMDPEKVNHNKIGLFDLTNHNSIISNFDGFTDVFTAAFDEDSKNVPTLSLVISNPDSISVFRANRRAFVDPLKIIDQVCDSLTQNISCKDWRENFPETPYRRTCPNLPAPACS